MTFLNPPLQGALLFNFWKIKKNSASTVGFISFCSYGEKNTDFVFKYHQHFKILKDFASKLNKFYISLYILYLYNFWTFIRYYNLFNFMTFVNVICEHLIWTFISYKEELFKWGRKVCHQSVKENWTFH